MSRTVGSRQTVRVLNVGCWPETDVPIALAHVSFEGEERKWRGLAAMSLDDPEPTSAELKFRAAASFQPVCYRLSEARGTDPRQGPDVRHETRTDDTACER